MLDKKLLPILLSRSRDQVVVHFDDTPRRHLDTITNIMSWMIFLGEPTCSGVRLDTNGALRGSCILLLISLIAIISISSSFTALYSPFKNHNSCDHCGHLLKKILTLNFSSSCSSSVILSSIGIMAIIISGIRDTYIRGWGIWGGPVIAIKLLHLDGWIYGWMDGLVDWSIDWLIGWLVDWLIDWLIGWWMISDWVIDLLISIKID